MTARVATYARYAPEKQRDASLNAQRGIRRVRAERKCRIVALGNSLMRSGMAAAFCDTFIAEPNRMPAGSSSGARARRDGITSVERRIATRLEAIEDELAGSTEQEHGAAFPSPPDHRP